MRSGPARSRRRDRYPPRPRRRGGPQPPTGQRAGADRGGQHWVCLATLAWSGVDRGASSPFRSVATARGKPRWTRRPATQSSHWSRFLHGSRRPGTGGGSFILSSSRTGVFRAARHTTHTTLARRPGMRSRTAAQRCVAAGMKASGPVTALARATDKHRRDDGQSHRIPTGDGFSGRQMPHRTPRRPAYALVRAYLEPPAGIEPATPSLPGNHREPLCGTPYLQVMPDRTARSYRFSFGEVMRSPTN
jgi:hypothetical protein